MTANTLNLLLIEDDDIDREVIRRLLHHRYTIYEASTAKIALERLEEIQPACILLDYRLPDVDGLQLIPKFAAAYIPVIVTTGEERPEVIVDAMRLGAQDYLVKNALSQTSLEYAINNAIEKNSLQRNLYLQQQKLHEQAAKLRKSNTQVRELASALTLAEQRERRRISQILHDHIQQMLHGIQTRSQLLELDLTTLMAEQVSAQELLEHLHAISQLATEALNATRTLTVELSPPALQGKALGEFCHWLVEQMEKLHNLKIDLCVETDYRFADEELNNLVFQFARELLFNIVKHADVRECRLTLRESAEHILLCIEDEGKGFDTDSIKKRSRGFGLHSINERLGLFGGHLTLESVPGQGTSAMVSIPKDSATIGIVS